MPAEVAEAASIDPSVDHSQQNRTVGKQLPRFLVVGVGNTIVSFVAYRLLLALGVWYVVAAPAAFCVGAINGYVFNRRWTFEARDSARARLVYLGVSAVGAVATSLLVPFLAEDFELGQVVAYLCAIPPVTLATFAANRMWTFAAPN